ncbi:hypothetical protein O181_028062 [Austropuccinia psidii MF-1]|uniref:Uncharacterized protein n=1 Tax=Austropuccinia psidii MF-1 TaxID=1389203 RepID=A0A9Q3CR53_9BASI|nr:hypothetical protein [Austropuccinia psidii MF-1]
MPYNSLNLLSKSCANVNKLKYIDSKANIAIGLDLTTKIFTQLEDREASTSQSFFNLITLCGLAGNLSHTKILLKNYCQIQSDTLKTDTTLNPLYHDHQLQPPLTLTLNQSTLSSDKIPNSHLADEKSDSQVLLAFMWAYLIKRLFNGDHASYHLDNPGRPQEFMDPIVRLACEPVRGGPGLGVAYDAAMISIDQIDSQFDTKAMGAVMARFQNLFN